MLERGRHAEAEPLLRRALGIQLAHDPEDSDALEIQAPLERLAREREDAWRDAGAVGAGGLRTAVAVS